VVYRIRAADRTAFKRCRRAWDLGSRNRRNHEPVDDRGADLDRGLHDALAVYYFPGMWEWNRAIVQPLVHQALDRSLAAQPGADEQLRTRGHALLDAYAAWAPALDRFTPVMINSDVEVSIPDPETPDRDLATTEGDAIRYTDRVDLLVIDDDDIYWSVQHRLVTDDWAEQDDLLLDERTAAWCWAWPLHYLGMRLAGTIFNEIWIDADADAELPGPLAAHRAGHRRMYARAGELPRERVRMEGTDVFRRTRIVRSDAELGAVGRDMAAEARAATDPAVGVYPSPAPEVCGSCAYRPPCLVMAEGADPARVLAADYRQREPEGIEEGRLGGATWSMNRGAAPPDWARRNPHT